MYFPFDTSRRGAFVGGGQSLDMTGHKRKIRRPVSFHLREREREREKERGNERKRKKEREKLFQTDSAVLKDKAKMKRMKRWTEKNDRQTQDHPSKRIQTTFMN